MMALPSVFLAGACYRCLTQVKEERELSAIDVEIASIIREIAWRTHRHRRRGGGRGAFDYN